MGNVLQNTGGNTLKVLAGGGFGSVESIVSGISSVSGTISDGNVLTVSGGGFGTGPTVVMFEDFSGGTDGIDGTTSNTGFDTTSTAYPLIFTTDSRSGSLAARMYRVKATDAAQRRSSNNFILLNAATEVFISYAIKTPTGKYFPGTAGGNSGTNADYSNASWKAAWLIPEEGTSGQCDLVVPSFNGSSSWELTGNGLKTKLTTGGANPTWWSWNNWCRMTTWVKAGADVSVDAGNIYFQAANGIDAMYENSGTPIIFTNESTGTPTPEAYRQWGQLNIAGWIKENAGGSAGGGEDIECLYDDIYVAEGPNAAARVELGNASTYAACTDLAICDSTSWANDSITVNCREGGLTLTANTWLYVTLSDNTTQYKTQVVTV